MVLKWISRTDLLIEKNEHPPSPPQKKLFACLNPNLRVSSCYASMQLFIKKTYLRDFEHSQTNFLVIPTTQHILFIRIL